MKNPGERLPDTALQHFGEEEKIKGAVVAPIFQNSLFVFEDFDSFSTRLPTPASEEPYVYSRVGNPSLNVVEKKIAYLEKTERCKVFGSGMAAISCAIMSCTANGAHIVCIDTCYSNTHQMLQDYLPRFGVTTTFVDGRCADNVIDAIKPETTLIYLESPSTFVFQLQDIEKITRVARERTIRTIFDNSYASPIFQTPAEMGIDMVVHSATKYLGGHSDITAGVACGLAKYVDPMVANETFLYGSALAPFPAWLLLRGLRTLRIRMQQHEIAGNAVAAYLEQSRFVERVNHVSLASYPQRELYLKQMRGSTGLLSFVPKFQTREQVERFVNALDLFQLGVSWGGFESLCVASTVKPLAFDEERWVIRLYCGLEDPRDMIADLEEGFKRV